MDSEFITVPSDRELVAVPASAIERTSVDSIRGITYAPQSQRRATTTTTRAEIETVPANQIFARACASDAKILYIIRAPGKTRDHVILYTSKAKSQDNRLLLLKA